MADSRMPSVGDHPDHGPVMTNPSEEAPVSLMFSNQFTFSTMPDSSLSSPFSQQRAVREPYEHATTAPTQGHLMSWMEAGPWVPPSYGGSASRMTFHSYPYHGQYRDTPCVPSECDTIPTGIEPSDSGYGSNAAKLSIANTSVLGEPLDRCSETQNLATQISGFNFNVPDPRPASMLQPQPPPVHYRSSHLEAKVLVCETCNKQVKTLSELKYACRRSSNHL